MKSVVNLEQFLPQEFPKFLIQTGPGSLLLSYIKETIKYQTLLFLWLFKHLVGMIPISLLWIISRELLDNIDAINLLENILIHPIFNITLSTHISEIILIWSSINPFTLPILMLDYLEISSTETKCTPNKWQL